MRVPLPGIMLAAFSALMTSAAPAGAADAPATVPSYIGRHTTTPEDQRAITQVVADFQRALKTKDVRLLASLMLNADIPFSSPASPQGIKKIREVIDPNANGLRAGGFHDFARFIHESKVPLEERFYNVRITQDKHVAWVMFDYEFVEDGKAGNYGIETWQMMQDAEGKWKIASVWWTTNLLQP
jgi:ketosteroid isomerase-like protein